MDSFLIRVWTDAECAGTPPLRGVARHVRSGEQRPFASADELAAFLSSHVAQAPAARLFAAADPDLDQVPDRWTDAPEPA